MEIQRNTPCNFRTALGQDHNLYSFSIVFPRVTTVALFCVHAISNLSTKLSLLVIVVTVVGHLDFITVGLLKFIIA